MKKILTYIFIFLFSFAFLCQDWWFISDWDDIFYKFIVADPNQGTVWQLMSGEHQYIRAFSDIIYSQYNHYMGSNGRFLVHCIVQACTSFLTSHQFAIINSLIFMFLLWGMIKLADKKMNYKNSIFVCILLFVFSPLTIADFFGNIAWSVNYLWTATATIWWLIMYEQVCKNNNKNIIYNICVCVLSIIVGSLQESFCIGMCAGLCLYHLLNIKETTWSRISAVGGYIIGACFCILSPANFTKVGNTTKGLSIDAIFDILNTYSILLFCMLFIICYAISKEKIIGFINKNTVLLLSFLFTLCFCLFYVYNGSRQYTLATLLSIILLVRLINIFSLKSLEYIKVLIILIGSLLCIVYYPSMYKLRKEIGQAYYSIVDEAVFTKSKIVYNVSYEKAREKIEKNILSKYFHINNINGNLESGYLSILVSDGSDMNYITAVLPVSLEEMERKCTETKDNAGVACLYNNIYACSLDEEYSVENVEWYYKTKFRNPYKWHNFSSKARYKLPYKGKYYYIFNAATNDKISQNVQIIE